MEGPIISRERQGAHNNQSNMQKWRGSAHDGTSQAVSIASNKQFHVDKWATIIMGWRRSLRMLAMQ
jgi:N-acetylglucosamine-6-phosphate deacetylase